MACPQRTETDPSQALHHPVGDIHHSLYGSYHCQCTLGGKGGVCVCVCVKLIGCYKIIRPPEIFRCSMSAICGLEGTLERLETLHLSFCVLLSATQFEGG